MRRKELKSIVLKYDKDASPDISVKAIVWYYNYFTNIIFDTGKNFRMPIFKLYIMWYIWNGEKKIVFWIKLRKK